MTRRRRGVALLAAAVLCGLLLLLITGEKDPSPPDRKAERDSSSEPSRAGPTDGASPDDSNGEEPPDLAAGAPGRAVAGRIVWPDGAPFEAGAISLMARDFEDEIEYEWLKNPVDGRFRFEGLRGVEYELSADHSIGDGIRSFTGWTVTAGREDYNLVIPERPGSPFLAVQVLDPRDRPVRSAKIRVDVLGCFGGVQDGEIEARNGAARCSVGYDCRRVLLAIHSAVDRDGVRLGERAVGPVDLTGAPVVVRLPAERALRGRVTCPEGKPVSAVKLAAGLAPPVLSFIGGFTVGIHDTPSETLADGRFEIRGLGVDDYLLRIRPPRPWISPPERRVVPGEGELHVVLHRGVEARIKVVDPKGRPVARCRLDLSDIEHDIDDDYTGRDGTAVLLPLDPKRRYTLTLEPPDEPPRATRKRLNAEGEIVDVDVAAARTFRPLEHRDIRDWTPADSTIRLEWEEPAEDEPDEPEGSPFRGDATLLLRIPNWPAYSENFQDVDGELICDGWAGPAKPVRVRPPDVEIEGLRSDRTYMLRLVGVGAGLALEAKGLRPGGEPVERSLTPGLRITGRIDLPPGTVYASVDVRQGELYLWEHESAVVLPDGTFEVVGLLPGTWKVSVGVQAGGEWFGADVDVKAGESVRVTPTRED